jgi:hypothetical protein
VDGSSDRFGRGGDRPAGVNRSGGIVPDGFGRGANSRGDRDTPARSEGTRTPFAGRSGSEPRDRIPGGPDRQASPGTPAAANEATRAASERWQEQLRRLRAGEPIFGARDREGVQGGGPSDATRPRSWFDRIPSARGAGSSTTPSEARSRTGDGPGSPRGSRESGRDAPGRESPRDAGQPARRAPSPGTVSSPRPDLPSSAAPRSRRPDRVESSPPRDMSGGGPRGVFGSVAPRINRESSSRAVNPDIGSPERPRGSSRIEPAPRPSPPRESGRSGGSGSLGNLPLRLGTGSSGPAPRTAPSPRPMPRGPSNAPRSPGVTSRPPSARPTAPRISTPPRGSSSPRSAPGRSGGNVSRGAAARSAPAARSSPSRSTPAGRGGSSGRGRG